MATTTIRLACPWPLEEPDDDVEPLDGTGKELLSIMDVAPAPELVEDGSTPLDDTMLCDPLGPPDWSRPDEWVLVPVEPPWLDASGMDVVISPDEELMLTPFPELEEGVFGSPSGSGSDGATHPVTRTAAIHLVNPCFMPIIAAP